MSRIYLPIDNFTIEYKGRMIVVEFGYLKEIPHLTVTDKALAFGFSCNPFDLLKKLYNCKGYRVELEIENSTMDKTERIIFNKFKNQIIYRDDESGEEVILPFNDFNKGLIDVLS